MIVELDMYIFFDKELNKMEITHQHTERKPENVVEIFHTRGTNFHEMKTNAKIALLAFNMGNITNGKGEVLTSDVIYNSFFKEE